MTTVAGIDISADQGQFGWDAWKGRIGFAMIRATSWDGDTFSEDPEFARNWQQAWDVFGGKLIRIAYHYCRPGITAPAVQAQGLTSIVRGQGLEKGDHFSLDFEESDGEPPAFVSDWSARALRAVNENVPGHRVLPYFDPSWAAEGNAAGLEAWHLWLANYDVTAPAVPAGWRTWTFWQWSDSGGKLDRDLWNGSVDELATFARMPASRR